MTTLSPVNLSHILGSIFELSLEHPEKFDPALVGVLLLVAAALTALGEARKRVVQNLPTNNNEVLMILVRFN